MCAPTVLACAVTALNEEQSSFAHTVNVRRLPGLGGPAGSGVTVVGDGTAADRASAAAPAGPLRARWRRNPSNWTAASRREKGPHHQVYGVATLHAYLRAGVACVMLRPRCSPAAARCGAAPPTRR